ncbi:SH3 domain-containing protein [Staphylococcus felis]|uniref:N-acetylmuramoyl-L-alanine amidase n=1 Tax=Staphylococcus felis TaxID=46127 RepID=A0ABS0QP15_9STAP|nr:SH3 domain-containing protein [Staphylococcus felis]MBH9580864.1 SH3 domain-containing protein [Staphylococcus felis]
MVASLTKKEFVTFLKSTEGKQFNEDGWYGFQCFDYANTGWLKLFGHKLMGLGAKDIPVNSINKNYFKTEAKVYANTPEFLAEIGDMVVFGENYGGGYGHVAWVIEATLDYIIVLEQNWLGGGWTDGIEQPGDGWEGVTRRQHAYDFPMWFIRPNFKSENVNKSSQSPTKSIVKQAKKQPKKLSYIRDEIRGYKMDKRGYKPRGIVLHNDAGSAGATAEAYHRGLVNADYNRLEKGVAHSYISGNTVYQALPEGKIAWHVANPVGNHDYYGIEICQSVGASDKQFLSNEQSAFQEAARMLKKWGLPANRNTVRLHVEFYNTACPHRSMLLHTGYDPITKGIAPQNIQLKLKDYFIKQIRAYMDGKVPTPTVSNNSQASSNTIKPIAGAWQINEYGTYYMKEEATFVCGNTPIVARTTGPFTTCPVGYNFQPGGWCDYDEVMLQDGHVWVGYTWKGQRYYLPIRTWNGVAPPNQGLGDLWGVIK